MNEIIIYTIFLKYFFRIIKQNFNKCKILQEAIRFRKRAYLEVSDLINLDSDTEEQEGILIFCEGLQGVILINAKFFKEL